MEGSLPWLLGGLAALVVLSCLLALAVQGFGRHLAAATRESDLFRRLAAAHGLSPEERRALSAAARSQGLPDPAVLFVSPSALARGTERLHARAPALARTASGLAERLFGVPSRA